MLDNLDPSIHAAQCWIYHVLNTAKNGNLEKRKQLPLTAKQLCKDEAKAR